MHFGCCSKSRTRPFPGQCRYRIGAAILDPEYLRLERDREDGLEGAFDYYGKQATIIELEGNHAGAATVSAQLSLPNRRGTGAGEASARTALGRQLFTAARSLAGQPRVKQLDRALGELAESSDLLDRNVYPIWQISNRAAWGLAFVELGDVEQAAHIEAELRTALARIGIRNRWAEQLNHRLSIMPTRSDHPGLPLSLARWHFERARKSSCLYGTRTRLRGRPTTSSKLGRYRHRS
jgi:hypothetical protein